MKRTLCTLMLALLPAAAYSAPLELKKGDHITYIGNTLADRMQHHGWLETMIHATYPKHELTFRNLGFPGDEVKTSKRTRSANFGSPDFWLTKMKADVVFCFFGYNEALKGEGKLSGFGKDLAGMIDGMMGQKYNGKSAPKLLMFSPIAHEDLKSPNLPDGKKNNKNLALYTKVMQDVCKSKNVTFIDLFTPTKKLYADAKKPLTMNGIHLLEHGDRAVAEVIMKALFGDAGQVATGDKELKKLHEVCQAEEQRILRIPQKPILL